MNDSTRDEKADDVQSETKPVQAESAALTSDDDLPVVARMVVEIRSDGSRTVARGAAEDADGKRVAIDARGSSPLSLAMQLSRSVFSLAGPRIGRRRTTGLVRNLLLGRKRRT